MGSNTEKQKNTQSPIPQVGFWEEKKPMQSQILSQEKKQYVFA